MFYYYKEHRRGMKYMYSKKREENTILYYPTIKIKDGAWLRNALLYWDKVSSIVPGSNYSETNSIEVEYLRDVGLYEPIYPIEMQNDEELCKEFCIQVRKNLKLHRKNLKNKTYFQIHIDKMRMSNENRIHIEKTPGNILEYLLDEGIAKRNCDGPWVDMNEHDANIYMATLARYLAKIHGNAEIGTDSSGKFLFPYVQNRSKNEIDKQIYLDIAMQEILPVPNLDISLEDIIDFKNKYKQPLKCFRRRIDEFQWSLRTCERVEELQERIQMLQVEIERDLQEIDELMSSSGIRKTKRALRALVPVGLEAGISVLGLAGIMSPMHTIIANAAVGLWAQLFCTEKGVQVDKDKAYLFYARQNEVIMPSRKYY